MTIWPLLCTPWLAGWAELLPVIIDLSGRPVKSFLHFVQGPLGVVAFGESFPEAANHGVQSKGHIVIPYTQGLCESIKKICGRYGIQTHFKGGKTIKNLLVSPKDKDPMLNQSGAIYRYQCQQPRLWWWVHRGNLQDLWWKIQRAPEGPLCYPSPQYYNRPHH